MLGIGSIIGFFAIWAAHAVIATVVPFQLHRDIAVFATAMIVFVATAALATFIPARIAANLNPVDTLRLE